MINQNVIAIYKHEQKTIGFYMQHDCASQISWLEVLINGRMMYCCWNREKWAYGRSRYRCCQPVGIIINFLLMTRYGWKM